MEPAPEKPPPLAVAMEWSTRVTTVVVEMALPALLGYWLDQRLGTTVVFVLIGVLLGMATGTWHLMRMSRGKR